MICLFRTAIVSILLLGWVGLGVNPVGWVELGLRKWTHELLW